jgi:hypothetical protein
MATPSARLLVGGRMSHMTNSPSRWIASAIRGLPETRPNLHTTHTMINSDIWVPSRAFRVPASPEYSSCPPTADRILISFIRLLSDRAAKILRVRRGQVIKIKNRPARGPFTRSRLATMDRSIGVVIVMKGGELVSGFYFVYSREQYV